MEPGQYGGNEELLRPPRNRCSPLYASVITRVETGSDAAGAGGPDPCHPYSILPATALALRGGRDAGPAIQPFLDRVEFRTASVDVGAMCCWSRHRLECLSTLCMPGHAGPWRGSGSDSGGRHGFPVRARSSPEAVLVMCGVSHYAQQYCHVPTGIPSYVEHSTEDERCQAMWCVMSA